MTRARSGPAVTVGGATAATGGLAAAALGFAYWRHLSPWSQALGDFPHRVETGERVVALTFDDGPNEPHTSALADLLREQDVRATFFQVGACAERFPEVTERLAADGHTIGNHSWSHSFRRCLDDEAMRTEIRRTQDLLTTLLGAPPRLYRPPWLLRTRGLFATLAEHGLTPVSGEFCHPLEPLQPPAAVIARRALARVTPGGLVIFHDGFDARGGNRANTVAAVRIVIDALRRTGYSFVTADDLLARRTAH